MSDTHKEEYNLLTVTEASPDANFQLAESQKGAARAGPGKCVGAGVLLMVSLAMIGILSSNTNNGANQRTMNVVRSLQETKAQVPAIPTTPTTSANANRDLKSICVQPTEGDDCYTNTSYLQCIGLESAGCESIIATRSCPPRYVCTDKLDVNTKLSTAIMIPTMPENAKSICEPPREGDDCHTNASYLQCVNLELAGCESIFASRSCPPQYVCAGTDKLAANSKLSESSTASAKTTPVPTPQDSNCYAPLTDDDCETDASYQECLALELSGCTQLISTYSCPPQYLCGDHPTMTSAPPSRPANKSLCLPADGFCSTEESYQKCLALEASGCKSMIATASCPPNFQCADATTSNPSIKPGKQPVESLCTAPTKDGCDTKESYNQCLALEADGCTQVISTYSCPPQYLCGDRPTPSPFRKEEKESLCLPADGFCSTEESYQKCLALEASGCKSMIATASCPPNFQCTDAMTSNPNIKPGKLPVESLCTAPSKDGCYTKESYNQCLALEADGCTQLISTYSCPPQYLCGDRPTASPSRKESLCLPADGFCSTEESYQKCLALETSGCKSMIATASCPPNFVCTDPTLTVQKKKPENSVTSVKIPDSDNASPPSAAVCQRPTNDSIGESCFTEEAYHQCMSLANAGCQQIAARRSCPIHYMCFD